jgi:REP element-mobilizing transposase RayT
LAIALARMRQKQRFALTAWVFLPDHWHAIIYPPYLVSISRVERTARKSQGRRCVLERADFLNMPGQAKL